MTLRLSVGLLGSVAALCAALGMAYAQAPKPAPAPEATAPLHPPEAAPSEEPSHSEDGVGPLMGKAWAYVRAPFEDAPLQQASTSAWLEVRPRFGPSYAHILLTGDALATSLQGGAEFRGRLREGYVGIGNERIDLRIGQQIIPWGNADVVSPSDLLTVRDLTFFSADPEANRLGVLSARASWTPVGPLNLVLVWTPVAPASTLLVPPGLLPPNVTLQSLRQPSPTLANSEVAARAGLTGHGWDIAVLGFRGWNHTPEFELRGIEPAGQIDIGTTQHAYLAAGLEGSASLSRWVFRLESTFVRTDNPSGNNPLVQPTHWDTVAGAETSFLDQHLRLQGQALTRIHPGYTSPDAATGPDATTTVVNLAIAHANAILLNYVSQVRVATSLRVAYATTNDKFGLEAFGLVDLEGEHDFLIRPLATYHATDALKFDLGAEIYGGPKSSPLGALGDYRSAFAQATYEF